MSEAGYYRYPTIRDDAIVFCSEDDLWRVDADGGVARRLTANRGPATWPALSPDGSRLAFIGREEGPTEVYVMPAEGGEARRLTYLGADTRAAAWTPEGDRVVFASDAEAAHSGQHALYAIAAEGGLPAALPTGPAATISFAPRGGGVRTAPASSLGRAAVIGRHTSDIARWKRYRGGLTGDLWIDPDGEGEWRRLLEPGGNVAMPLWLGDRIYFVSDHEGIGNLYRCRPDGEALERVTAHDDYYVRHPATDGRRIVYHAGADLYLFDPEEDAARLVEVRTHSPRVQRGRRQAPAAAYLRGAELHPEGEAVLVGTRGKAFAMSLHEGAALPLGAGDGEVAEARFRLACWLPDGRRVVAVTDAAGEEGLVVLAADGRGPDRRLPEADLGRPTRMAVSPREERLVLANHRNELLLVELESGEARVLDRCPHGRLDDFCWSPDGRWLAYRFQGTAQTSHIRLLELEGGEIVEATRPVLQDVSPAFDPTGRYLWFLSYREFHPVYDNLHFDLGFPRGVRPYVLMLRADDRPPFAPEPPPPGGRAEDESAAEDQDENANGQESDDQDGEGESSGGENGDAADAEAATSAAASEASRAEANGEAAAPEDGEEADDASGEDETGPEPLRIDREGLAERIAPLPVAEGRYGQIAAVDGKVLYTSFGIPSGAPVPTSGAGPAGSLKAFDLQRRKEESLAEGVSGFALSRDGKHLLYRSGSRLRVVPAGRKPPAKGSGSRETGWLDLGRIRLLVEPSREWPQMFREAWRLQRDQFWTENMAGLDWEAVYRRYEPLLARVASRTEFSDLMWEMQGELGTSHAYEYGGDHRPSPPVSLGHLVADWRWDDEAAGWRLEDFVRGDAWSERASSPFARAGVDVQVGDVLRSVDGRPLDERTPPAARLVDLAGRDVLLGFAPRPEEAPNGADADADAGAPARAGAEETSAGDEGRPLRLVTVRTLGQDRRARYRAWVEGNRRRVHEASEGRVGYVHVPDMGTAGYAEFHRGYLAEVDRPGLIVDVRFNGGGHVSSLILEKLARRRLGYDVQRWGEPIPYPRESVMGPLVALTNESAGSDGDMFSHAFKLMELGPLIGRRTWGGVVGIWPRERLADGGVTTQPEYSIWFDDVGWGLENFGTEPDIEVEIRPQDHVAGRDPQLERGIREALERLAADPPRLPRFSPPPSRALPRLPRNGDG